MTCFAVRGRRPRVTVRERHPLTVGETVQQRAVDGGVYSFEVRSTVMDWPRPSDT
ncbi:hypothetical protein Acsp01_71550 [Actinoplanes sp. NBRC 101535]|nr:hypothetical protein Acsp01_71550 [Actinoplanes sp. NBRC 101535]